MLHMKHESKAHCLKAKKKKKKKKLKTAWSWKRSICKTYSRYSQSKEVNVVPVVSGGISSFQKVINEEKVC